MTNRDRLVLAAGDLFYRNGYAATSVEDILERTGVARSNFYYHFDGKLDLAREVLRRWVADFEAHLVTTTEDGAPAAARLRSIFREVRVAPWTQEAGSGSHRLPCPMGPLALELAPHDVEVRSLAAEFLRTLRRSLRDVIAEGSSRGEFDRSLDPDAAAAVAVATLQGGLLLSHTNGVSQPLRRAESALLELLARRDDGR
jgi:TetR/AcrR family transcriptional repressor of nem operon